MQSLAFAFVLFSVSTHAFGALKLAMELEYEGKKISPAVTVQSGQTASIGQDDFRIEVKAKELDKKVADLAFKIFRTSAGTERLLASPSVRTRLGSAAEVSETPQGQTTGLRLKVTPTHAP
jgi:hypothetical protein